MTYTKACEMASKNAKAANEWRYVVEERWSDAPGSEYWSATEDELETYFYGCPVILTFGPDGNPEP